jgi:hypothetical protein
VVLQANACARERDGGTEGEGEGKARAGPLCWRM